MRTVEHSRPQKTCTKCQEEKELGSFSRNSSARDGMDNRCRACKKAERVGGPTREQCLTPGCTEERKRYYTVCSACHVEVAGECATPGCHKPRQSERKWCGACRSAVDAARRHAVKRERTDCKTDGCGKNAINGTHCKLCERDRKKPQLMIDTKICKDCFDVKALIEFWPRFASEDGRCATCRVCSAAANARAVAKKSALGETIRVQLHQNYHEKGCSLGFVASHMLSVPLHDTIRPCPERYTR